MAALVEVHDLCKVYRDGTIALKDLTFSVERGEAFALLGPNGAGKTTTIRILVTLLGRTSGLATVAGLDVGRQAERVRGLIGYAAQSVAVDIDLTARENLVMQGRLQAMRKGAAMRRADELLDRFSFGEVADKRAGLLSGGMRRRLDLAQALVHSPPLLFLDEPTTGLDPKTRVALWSHLRELGATGTTLFLTTQYLEEADRLCDRVAIVDRGQLLVVNSPGGLKHEIGDEVVTVRLTEEVTRGDIERAVRALEELPGVQVARSADSVLTVPVRNASRTAPGIVRLLDRLGLVVVEMAVATTSLEEVFLKYTGEQTHQDEAPAETARTRGLRNVTRR